MIVHSLYLIEIPLVIMMYVNILFVAIKHAKEMRRQDISGNNNRGTFKYRHEFKSVITIRLVLTSYVVSTMLKEKSFTT